ncbi:MAG TPA: D-2-hydroxyacid dehydrogenase [Steroidobacteraceae bacterium]|nr:D-2-hydroxyacid dehydrogenase [Steroidobacteraceae bacterium]
MPPRQRLATPTVLLVAGAACWLSAALAQAPAAPARAAQTSGAPAPDAELIESLGLRTAPHPVRERPGWHPPHLILVSNRLEKLLPQLARAAPGAKLVALARATPQEIAAADATIGVCSPEVLRAAQHLQWIQWTAAGVEPCVQQPLLRARAPLVTNLQRTMGPSMAEHVLALMLALSRHLEYFMAEQQRGHWTNGDEPELVDLEGRTVLVAGLGGIGTEVARRAHALGMRVVATRASGHEGPDFVSYVGLPDELPKLSRDADFVVNCLPLTPETTGIFNRQFFAGMKKSAFFISVGRGRSTVTADLTAALTDGTIAGAGLDVVDPEPLPPESPLWHAPHLIITPHVSAHTPIAQEARESILVENLRRYVAGEPMLSVVDIEKGY